MTRHRRERVFERAWIRPRETKKLQKEYERLFGVFERYAERWEAQESRMRIISASLMYVAEHRAQPEAFSSIPAAMWWAVATLTTVGYGDVYPVTGIGRAMGSVAAILGIGMFALPAGILGSAFLEEVEERKSEEAPAQRCPHCGEELDTRKTR